MKILRVAVGNSKEAFIESRFTEGLNIISSDDNNKGKTIVIQSMMHILNELSPHGFKHYEQSLRVVDVLEKGGGGLNLTYEVRDGILNHAGTMTASTFEGKIIKYAVLGMDLS